MFHLFDHFGKFAAVTKNGSDCDDFIDRLNRKYTIYLLMVCCAIISSKQYVGEPLSCFCPSHFTGAHVEYTNNICWISNAYYVPIDDLFSLNGDNNNYYNFDDDDKPNSPIKVVKVTNLIAYYPFLLLIQAIFFYIPYFLWKSIVNHSAYDINTLISYAKDTQSIQESSEHRGKALKYLIKHIDRASNYYNAKKTLKFRGNSSDVEAEETLARDLTKHIDEDYEAKKKSTAVQRKNRFDFAKSFLSDNKESSLNMFNSKRSDTNGNTQFVKFKHFFRKYILDTLCEKFLFTLYLIIKLFYFTNSFGQLLILNKLITGDTNSMQKLFSTLASPFATPASANSASNRANLNNNQIFQSLFTITNKNDVYLIQQKYDNNNYFLMASNNVWTGFEFGYKAIINLIQTGSLFNSHTRLLIFHSVIFCDFKIRVLGDRLHKHTVQCVAPINIFSEKLFTLIWFWFLILTILNAYTVIEWLNFYLFSRIRFNFMMKYINKFFNNSSKVDSNIHRNNKKSVKINLEMSAEEINYLSPKQKFKTTKNLIPNETEYAKGTIKLKFDDKNEITKQKIDENLAKKIIKSYLELDNLFVVRLISKNTNQVITQELINLLLDYYQTKNQVFIEDNLKNKINGTPAKKSINL